MSEKNLSERREKIKKNLKNIIDSFIKIESLLTPWQKRNRIRGLGKKINVRYYPIKNFEQISAEYTDEKGVTYEIKISYKNKLK